MNKYVRSVVYALFISVIFYATTFNIAYAHNVIRVGFFEFDGFYNIDSDAVIGGYGYDYLQEISKYTGWQYEYIPCSWSSCQEMLKNGEIDILGSAQRTPERETYFSFPKLDSGVSYVILTVNSKNSSIAFGDYESFIGLKVGLIKGNSRNNSFNEFMTEHNLSLDTVYYSTQDELTEALLKHDVDAILTSNLRKITNERVIASFAPSPFYFITNKGNTNIVSQLDDSINHIKNINPYYDIELCNKHYPKNKEEKLVLSKKELDFVKNHQKINVVYDAKWKPISYSDTKSGEIGGAVADIFKLIADKTGLVFNFIPTDSVNESMQYVREGKAEIIASLPSNDIVIKNSNFLLSTPYLKLQIALIKNKNVADISNARLAVRSDHYSLSLFLHNNNYFFKPSFYDDSKACVEAIFKGDADATYLNTFVAEYLMQNPKYRNLSFMTVSDLKYEVSAAFSAKSDRALFTIVNKAINNISSAEYNAIIFSNALKNKYEKNLISIIYSNPAETISVIALIFVLLFLTIMLRNSMTQARIANQLKSLFIAKMSHEIRTPINAIMGFIRLLRDENPNKTSLEYISIIENSSKTLLELVNSILDISKIESGKTKLEPKEFEITDELDSIARLFVGSSLENDTRVLSFIDARIPRTVIGDQQKLRQAISNLLGNALKFTDTGGYIYFECSVVEKDIEHVEIRFSIRDTGIGIPKNDLYNIFNPFHQLADSTICKTRGTGLGLTISKEFVTLMGGDISVKSEVGQGSEFFFTLSFKIVDEFAPFDFSAGNICCIELPESKEFLKKNLVSLGCKQEYFDNIEQLFCIDTYQYDLIVIAIHYINNDFFETLYKLRRNNSKTSILLIGYHFEIDTTRKLEEINITLHLQPIKAYKLCELISRMVTNTNQQEVIIAQVERLKFKARVLIAEDDKINRKLIRIVLSKYGLDVEIVSDGKQAFDRYAEGFDIIFMDINMPVMNGIDATSLIRNDEIKRGVKRTPIIAFTANIMKGDDIKYSIVGIDDVLSKPFNINILETVLKRYLRK